MVALPGRPGEPLLALSSVPGLLVNDGIDSGGDDDGGDWSRRSRSWILTCWRSTSRGKLDLELGLRGATHSGERQHLLISSCRSVSGSPFSDFQ